MSSYRAGEGRLGSEIRDEGKGVGNSVISLAQPQLQVCAFQLHSAELRLLLATLRVRKVNAFQMEIQE